MAPWPTSICLEKAALVCTLQRDSATIPIRALINGTAATAGNYCVTRMTMETGANVNEMVLGLRVRCRR